LTVAARLAGTADAAWLFAAADFLTGTAEAGVLNEKAKDNANAVLNVTRRITHPCFCDAPGLQLAAKTRTDRPAFLWIFLTNFCGKAERESSVSINPND
jgi:hypothetical protein